jgi:hypothetical protein
MTAGSGTPLAERSDPVSNAGEVSNGWLACRPAKANRVVSVPVLNNSSSVTTSVCR